MESRTFTASHRLIHTVLALVLAMIATLPLSAQVLTGAERTSLWLPGLRDKHVGIVANSASVVGHVNTVDTMVRSGINVVRIFSPEHGFRTQSAEGRLIADSVDPATGIRVISLYGSRKKPVPADLSGLDVVVFDLQDAGVRFYTYISTLSYVMEACAENNLPVIVLDRPNPNGFYVDGPVLEKRFSSFVGMHPVPVVYGMTIGEYAQMVNGEGWLQNGVRCNLRVVPLDGYDHATRCILPEKPSPNLPNPVSIQLYPSLCFFEGTPVSVGRGTDYPFQVFGHPELGFGDFMFTPQGKDGYHPPLEGKVCRGLDLRRYFDDHPGASGRLVLDWLIRANRSWTSSTPFFTDYFDKLAGTDKLRRQITAGKTEQQIRAGWQKELQEFRKIRAKYLLYPEQPK